MVHGDHAARRQRQLGCAQETRSRPQRARPPSMSALLVNRRGFFISKIWLRELGAAVLGRCGDSLYWRGKYVKLRKNGYASLVGIRAHFGNSPQYARASTFVFIRPRPAAAICIAHQTHAESIEHVLTTFILCIRSVFYTVCEWWCAPALKVASK